MASVIWEMDTGLLAVIEFDAVTAETHVAQADITEHPVEVGANISDHSRPKLRTVQLEGVITNTPLNETTVQDMYPIGAILGSNLPFTLTGTTSRRVTPASVVGGWVSPFRFPGTPRPAGTPAGITATYVPSPWAVSGAAFQSLDRTDRVKACFEALVELCLTGRLIRYVSDLQEYDSMMVASVTAPRRAEDAIRFQLELKEVRFANTRTVSITKKKPREKRATEPVSEGAKASYDDAIKENGLESVAQRVLKT